MSSQQTTPAAKPARPPEPKPPAEFQEGAIASMEVSGLLAIVRSGSATEFQKAKACQRLGELGAKEAVPALAALLPDEHLSTYARYGLEPIAGPSVDEALRAALPKLKGEALIGVINSLGKRRDANALPALAKLMHGSGIDVARAAAAAMGSIGGPSAARELQPALGKTTGVLRASVADACLVCAERLLASGGREQAMALYAAVSVPGMPQPQRLAAMNSIIREETAVTRPR